ncbi:MAG: tetratricopeptide repeat protein [Bryobacteraceae bacterium]|jgi:serine/threonine protein kinase/tetratricopeptide (TPR) repeat protein
MNPDDLEEIERLYHSALERPERERSAFLKAACGADEGLRREVDSLLAYRDGAEDFMESAAMAVEARALARDEVPLQGPGGGDARLLGKTISRYRILERLGAGGMGVVYKAQDTVLGRYVALKFLTESAGAEDDAVLRRLGRELQPGSDSHAVERLKREARAASAIDHPNICTIHEIGEHEGQPFIVMQFLEGQTLKDRITGRPLPLDEFWDQALAIAGALEAAHAKGILHRDIKPANIFVTSRGEVKVLDFGLAKAICAPKADAAFGTALAASNSLTDAGAAVGTAPYMSPEQARGEELDARSDIFSLGAVLYEMATGHQAFPGKTCAVVFNKLLSHAPGRPSLLNPELPLPAERIIDKALEKDRHRRYQTAALLRADLQAVRDACLAGSALPGGVLRRGVSQRAAAMALSLALIGIAVRYAGPWRPKIGSSRPSIAVLNFKNLSPRPDKTWLASALPEMLTTELAAGEKLRTVSGEDVARTKTDLALPDADSYAPRTLLRIRKNLNADYVVLGSYLASGPGKIRLDIRLQRAADGETVAAVPESGDESEISDLVARAGVKLRQKLGAGEITPADAAVIRAALPSDREATRLYAEGLTKLRFFDANGAQGLLQKAVAAEPQYALAHSALSAAWSELGYDAKAQEEARKAFDLSAGLARESHLTVEGRYHETMHEWDKAATVYRTLHGFFPDNIDYGLLLAHVQTNSGKPRDALATVQDLVLLPPPASGDPRIDLALAEAYRALSQFRQQEAAAARAAEMAGKQGARLWAAYAIRYRASALHNLGRTSEAAASYTEAVRVFSAAGNRKEVARCLNSMAALADGQGDYPRARQLYEQAGQISREIGYPFGVAASLSNVSELLSEQGDYSGAEKLCRQSLVVYRQIGDRPHYADALTDCGVALQILGNLSVAKEMYQEALGIYREVGNHDREAFSIDALGSLLLDQGNLTEGQKMLEQAGAFWKESGNRGALAFALSNLAETAETRGDLLAARQKHQEALSIRRDLGQQVGAAQSEIGLATLSIEEGRPEAALAPAREVAEVFRINKAPDDEAAAYRIVARALLLEHKASEAIDAIHRAQGLAAKSQDFRVRLYTAIMAARAEAALEGAHGSGGPTRAAASLKSAAAEGRRRGIPDIEFEARLALGEVEFGSGNARSGRQDLLTLKRDAQTAGFGLIAAKAEKAMR